MKHYFNSSCLLRQKCEQWGSVIAQAVREFMHKEQEHYTHYDLVHPHAGDKTMKKQREVMRFRVVFAHLG